MLTQVLVLVLELELALVLALVAQRKGGRVQRAEIRDEDQGEERDTRNKENQTTKQTKRSRQAARTPKGGAGRYAVTNSPTRGEEGKHNTTGRDGQGAEEAEHKQREQGGRVATQ